jgi:hypothetical protein
MHETDGSPEISLWIDKEILPVTCWDHTGHFPAMSLLSCTPAHMIGEDTHILHD